MNKGNEENDYIMGFCDYFDEDEDDVLPVRHKGMRKMSKKEEKMFPKIAVDSLKCQSYHIARFEICEGCEFAISGCEKVFRMSAG